MADDSVSKPYVWSAVPAGAVGFKTASRQNTGSVRVDIELDRRQTGTWREEVAKDPDQAVLQKLRIQTPRFRKFAVKEWKDRQTGRVSWSGSFTLGDLEGPGLPAKFVRDWVKPVETRVVETAAAKSIEWFKKAKTVDDLKGLFTSSVNEGGVSAAGNPYGPLMKCKVPFARGKFQCQFYKGDSGKPSSLDEYLKATAAAPAECVAILDYESVWFMGRAFGVTPVLSSLLYFPSDRLTEFSFVGEYAAPAAPDDEDRSMAEAFLDDRPAKRQKVEDPEPAGSPPADA